jgi:hypothetical protein
MKPRVLSVLHREPSVEERVVEELVYGRLKLAIDFCELLTFHEDLAAAVQRAIARSLHPPSERAEMTMRYVRHAWERLGDEVLGQLAELSLPSQAE